MSLHLITYGEVKTLGRPISEHIDEDKINAFITEVEQIKIKTALGPNLFYDLLEKGDKKPEYDILLNGGTYSDSHGNVNIFKGLKTTIAYYVLAQNIMSGDFQSTRFGTVFKENDFSNRISSKERSDFYNNTLEVANFYLKECVNYCKYNGLIKNHNKGVVCTGGVTIRKIGK